MSNSAKVIAVVGIGGVGGAAAGLLSAARQIASAKDAQLTALLLSTDHLDQVAGLDDADDVVVANAPWLHSAGADMVVAALVETCASLKPSAVLFTHDSMSGEVAPRLAARLEAGLMTECGAAWVEASTGALVGERACFSGKATGTWAIPAAQVAVLTLRRQPPRDDLGSATAPAQTSSLRLVNQPEPRAKLLGQVFPPAGEIKLEEAEIVVGVGRGIASPEAFNEHFVNGLAPAINAVCGGSRGAVDMGIIPPNLQIGLTGRVIAPRVYIAVGLSGSPQHMAGCSGSRTIVAVNKDPQAPIFSFAHYGVVGDYRQVIPSLTERLKQLRLVAV